MFRQDRNALLLLDLEEAEVVPWSEPQPEDAATLVPLFAAPAWAAPPPAAPDPVPALLEVKQQQRVAVLPEHQ